jgi:hypothetical protein
MGLVFSAPDYDILHTESLESCSPVAGLVERGDLLKQVTKRAPRIRHAVNTFTFPTVFSSDDGIRSPWKERRRLR